MRRSINPFVIIFLLLLLLQSFRSGEFSDPKAWLMNTIMLLPGIIVGLAFHEYAHAITAYKLGDITPKLQGRVTINPVAHIEPFGFIALIFCGFGWGKAVEINPANFKKRRRDELIVSLAGVVMNFIIAIVFTAILKIVISAMGPAISSYTTDFGYYLQLMLLYAVQINLVLMIFNLIPVPPLDGFSVIIELFNLRNTEFYRVAYNYGQWILLILLFVGVVGRILSPAVFGIMNLLFQIFGIPIYL